MPIDKIVDSFDEAVADVADGSVVHIGGFGGPAEYPSYLIAALARKGVTGLTITGNHSGFSMEQLAMMREHMASLLGCARRLLRPGAARRAGPGRQGHPRVPGIARRRVEGPVRGAARGGQGRARADRAGEPGRADPCRARRHRRVLYAGRRGHRGRRRQGRPLVRRPAPHPRARDQGRPVDHPRPTRRTAGATSCTAGRPARSTRRWPAPRT